MDDESVYSSNSNGSSPRGSDQVAVRMQQPANRKLEAKIKALVRENKAMRKEIDLLKNSRKSAEELAKVKDMYRYKFLQEDIDSLKASQKSKKDLVKVKGEYNGLSFSYHHREYHDTNNCTECAWLPLPKSVIGQFLRWYLGNKDFTWEVVGGGMMWLSAFVVGVILQIYVLRSLWLSLPDIDRQNRNFCQNQQIGRSLQLCAIGIFLLSVGEAFNDIFIELLIVIWSKSKCIVNPDGKLVDKVIKEKLKGKPKPEGELVTVSDLTPSCSANRLLCLLIVLTEGAVWVVVVIVGVKYLLSAGTVSDLVQSAVAIVFVNEIDNLAHSAIAPATIAENLNNEEYQIKWLAPNRVEKGNEIDACQRWWQGVFHNSSLYLTVPTLVVISVSIVYGMHSVYC